MTSESSSRNAAIDWLMGRINYERVAVVPYGERQLKLDRMRQLLTRLGQPDAGMKIVHVAGTKGKGSTAIMIAAVLSAAGYRTGVFSSPHLERIEQRMTVDSVPCSAAELVALVDRVRPVVRAMDDEGAAANDPTGEPTFFEVITALTLLHFAERQVDFAVLEVGLGGRLDSTNVCLPAVSVITSISLDHTKQLGETLAEIAGEKAGIIKPGVPVVSGVTEPSAGAVISEIAREHGCRLVELGRDFQFQYHPPQGTENRLPPSGGTIDVSGGVFGEGQVLTGLELALRGPHQGANGAVALAAIAELRHQGACISTDAIRQGLAGASIGARFELVPGSPAVVLDTAHNVASARAFVAALKEFPCTGRRTLILSVSRDKDVRSIVAGLVPHFDRVLVTAYQENPRAVPVEELAEVVASVTAVGVHASTSAHARPVEAWNTVRQSWEPGELVCITGSFFLAAEMRPVVLACRDECVHDLTHTQADAAHSR